MDKISVYHQYDFPTTNLSPYGKAAAIVEALSPLKSLPSYGYYDRDDKVYIWWRTKEDKS